jgi:hypothetical protein
MGKGTFFGYKVIVFNLKTEQRPHVHKQSDVFCDAVIKLFKKACEIGHKFINGDISRDRAGPFRLRLYSAIDSIAIGKLKNKKAENFRKRILDTNKEYNRLFTFLKYPGVQPTNNHA